MNEELSKKLKSITEDALKLPQEEREIIIQALQDQSFTMALNLFNHASKIMAHLEKTDPQTPLDVEKSLEALAYLDIDQRNAINKIFTHALTSLKYFVENRPEE